MIKKIFNKIKKLILNSKTMFIIVSLSIGGAIKFFEQIKQIYDYKSIYYALLFIDLFKNELILFCVFYFWWDYLLKFTKKFFESFYKLKQSSTCIFIAGKNIKTRNIIMHLSSIVFVVSCFAAYNLYHYAYGKYIYLLNYDRLIINKSNSLFSNGNIEKSISNLEVCVNLLSSKRCNTRLDELKERVELADSMRLMLQAMDRVNFRGRKLVIEDIYYLDRDKVFYNDSLRAVLNDINYAKSAYSDSIHSIMTDQNDKALNSLQDLNQKFPGYCDTHVLINEMLMLKNNNMSKPYILYLKKNGIKDFLSKINVISYSDEINFDGIYFDEPEFNEIDYDE